MIIKASCFVVKMKKYIGIENAYAPIREIIGNLKRTGWKKIVSYVQLIDNACSITKNKLKSLGNTEFSYQK